MRNLPILALLLFILAPIVKASPLVISEHLQIEDGWEAVEIRESGLTIEEKDIPGISMKAVRVSQVMEIDPDILSLVVEDVANYGQFLTSAKGLTAEVISVNENELIGYQLVDIPVLSDRQYAFRMFRPTNSNRVDWQLLPRSFVSSEGRLTDDAVYLELGVGSWTMEPTEDGKYKVAYRLVMDPGGWIPESLGERFNRIAVTGLFTDAVAETQRRATEKAG